MKRNIVLTLAIAAALLLVFSSTKGTGQAQNLRNQSFESAGSDPAGAIQQAGEIVEWLSSDPAPEGVQISGPANSPVSIDALDAAPTQTYDSSLRVAGATLKPRESNVEWQGVAGAGGCIYASSGSTHAVFNTPIYLPQGSTVKYLRLYYSDTNTSTNSIAWFTAYDLYGAVAEEYNVTSTGDGGNGYATTTELTHTVDYASYSYVLNWRPYDLGSDTQVCGFRLYYAAPPGPVFVPLVMKDTP